MLEISCYNSSSVKYQLSKKLLNSFELSNDAEQKIREELFIKKICQNVEKSKFVLYVVTFKYLLDLIIHEAKEIQSKVGVKYIVLLPDNDNLLPRYQELGFEKINHKENQDGWMFFSL